jgi:energy-coupling factor transporter ATP-binding protein EcfA2
MSFSISKRHPVSSLINALDQQLKRTDDPLPIGQDLIWLIAGGKGSGKSTLILNLLMNPNSPYKKHFDTIWLCSPTARRDPKFEPLINELDNSGRVFDGLDNDVAEAIEEQLKDFNAEVALKNKKRKKKKTPHHLVILDDCLFAMPRSQDKRSAVNRVFTTSRHLKTSIWCLVQKYNAINPLIRNQADLVSLFRTRSEQ